MPDDDLPRPDVVVGISWPGRTAEEADILDMVARDNGREWTERRADSILDQRGRSGSCDRRRAMRGEPMPEKPTDKPTLSLAPGDMTLEECLALFRHLTGREASAEEIEDVRRELARPVSGDSD